MRRHPAKLILAAVLLGAPQGSALAAAAQPIQIKGRDLPLVREIDERFQSFQIGMSHLTGGETWRSYDDLPQGQNQAASGGFEAIREPRQPTDLTHARLRTLAAALGPFYLRYSGTTANSVYFQDNDEPALTKAPDGYKVVLTRAAWKGAVDFAQAVNAKIVTSFTNSDGVRDSSGAWTPRMAAPWLSYTRSIGGEIYAAELFNEPNAPEPGRMPEGHTAAEFARDFARFSDFMGKAAPDVKLAGPGDVVLAVPVPSIDKFTAEQYITADPRPTFNILSYHFYPALAERCAPANSPHGISDDKALSEEWLARPDDQFQKHKSLRDRYAPGAPIWITETGGASCGGLRWQPTFLDTFRYLDTHARLAKQGLDAMFTHALISGSNGVIDEKTFTPNASYWAALLWRRLMGTRVLDAGAIRSGTHVYAHCLPGKQGGVTVLAINLETKPKTIKVSTPPQVYALTAPELQSRTVLLNGQPLALDGDKLPNISPKQLNGKRVTLAPTSISFITLPQAGNPNCTD